jgi:insertion element IS1 protein InsB
MKCGVLSGRSRSRAGAGLPVITAPGRSWRTSVVGVRRPCVGSCQALLTPFGLTRYDTDYGGAYERHLAPEVHSLGKHNTQQIERKHLTLRPRLKRLVRRTLCFSKSIALHDIVIGLFINRYEFGLPV